MLSTPLLVLDDCFSSVVLETELAILSNLRRYLKDRTTLIASHRLGGNAGCRCNFCTRVVAVCASRETTTNFSAQNGLYAALYRRQKLEAELYEEAGKRLAVSWQRSEGRFRN